MEKKDLVKLSGIPEPVLKRLPKYLNYIKSIQLEDKFMISAPQIADHFGSDPTQVTKDIAFTGATGKTKVGYNIAELIDSIEEFLGFRRPNEAFLVGAGNLGTALMKYDGFKDIGFKIIAAFDSDPLKVGTEITGVKVLHISKLRSLAERLHVIFGIITTPASEAQQIADLMVGWGIRAIWNFAPVNLQVPKGIIVQNTLLYDSLAVILNKVKELYDNSPENEIKIIAK